MEYEGISTIFSSIAEQILPRLKSTTWRADELHEVEQCTQVQKIYQYTHEPGVGIKGGGREKDLSETPVQADDTGGSAAKRMSFFSPTRNMRQTNTCKKVSVAPKVRWAWVA